jgi:hypothetical protein
MREKDKKKVSKPGCRFSPWLSFAVDNLWAKSPLELEELLPSLKKHKKREIYQLSNTQWA